MHTIKHTVNYALRNAHRQTHKHTPRENQKRSSHPCFSHPHPLLSTRHSRDLFTCESVGSGNLGIHTSARTDMHPAFSKPAGVQKEKSVCLLLDVYHPSLSKFGVNNSSQPKSSNSATRSSNRQLTQKRGFLDSTDENHKGYFRRGQSQGACRLVFFWLTATSQTLSGR